MELIRASLSQTVKVGGHTYQIRPPTVCEALTLLATQPRGEHDDETVFRQALQGWFPPSMFVALEQQGRGALVTMSKRLMREFTPGTSGKSKQAEQSHGTADLPEWSILLLDYAMATSSDPHQVYTETPWPFFLVMVRDLIAAEARQHLRELDLVTLPHSGKSAENVLKRMQLRAKLAPEGVCDPTQSRMMTDPEYREAQLRRLENFVASL